jgi:hypothetical protein
MASRERVVRRARLIAHVSEWLDLEATAADHDYDDW